MNSERPADEAEGPKRTLHAEALVGRRIPSVAHDLATPLSTISLRAELLLSRLGKQATPEAEKDARAVRTMLEAATRCNQLLTALRNQARLPSPGAELLALGPLLAEAFELVASPARHKDLALEADAGLDLLQCRAPRGPMQQAVLGLVAFAVSCAEARSALTVTGVATGASGIELRFRGAAAVAADRDLEAAREAAQALAAALEIEAGPGTTTLRLRLPA
ncbi:MAG: hypothetical protein NDJ94_19370 [Vicinamibacteria bacterium]|jgi:nitrogen fixation/metabolism regulation signal transduction histidine kinase|nr:hypothetical protein [Vicinamibacteria bacterium]